MPRPQSLANAVGMMWIGAAVHAIGALSSFLFIDQVRDGVEDELRANGQVASESTIDAAVTIGLIFGVFAGLLGSTIWVWMAVKNGAGRSWARIVATILGVLGSVGALFGLLGASIGANGSTAASVVQNLITLGLAIGILVLLWRPDSSQYYAANS